MQAQKEAEVAALAQKASYAREAQVQVDHSTRNHDVPQTHSPATSHSASAAMQRTISPTILHRRKRLGMSSRISLTTQEEEVSTPLKLAGCHEHPHRLTNPQSRQQ